jgi:hypothetical protein
VAQASRSIPTTTLLDRALIATLTYSFALTPLRPHDQSFCPLAWFGRALSRAFARAISPGTGTGRPSSYKSRIDLSTARG